MKLAHGVNYGQGKTFLSWKLALTIAGQDDRSHTPFFYPLKQYNPNSETPPLDQVEEYLRKTLLDVSPTTLFDRRNCLLILDAVDEIPVNRAALQHVLRRLLESLDRFPRLAILLTYRSGLFPGRAERCPAELSAFRIGHLEPWQAGGSHWERLLRLCHETNYARFSGGWEHFRDEVARRPLRDLTSRPLWCRMIVENRDTILGQTIHSEADLYRFYVEEFFRSRAGVAQILSRDQKLRVLEVLGMSMARAGDVPESGVPKPVRVTEVELRRAAAQTFQTLPDSEIAEYLSSELRTYSLLNCDTFGGDRVVYSFGHYSFQEYFQSLALLRLLTDSENDLMTSQDDLVSICQRIVVSKDLLGFVAGLLRGHPASHVLAEILRRDVRTTFGSNSEEIQTVRQALLRSWLAYNRRVLGRSRPDLVGFRLDRLTLDELDLSRCHLRLASLAGSSFLRCDFTGADLSESNCRGTSFERCTLTDANFTNAQIEGASGLGFDHGS